MDSICELLKIPQKPEVYTPGFFSGKNRFGCFVLALGVK